MDLRDYDRDGWATEFFLQLETETCGKLMGIAVGVSRKRPALHALTSVAHPERPLVLRIDQWHALAKTAGPFTSVALRCGDHASSEQYELTLAAAAGRINVTSRVYACDANDKKGRLLRTDVE